MNNEEITELSSYDGISRTIDSEDLTIVSSNEKILNKEEEQKAIEYIMMHAYDNILPISVNPFNSADFLDIVKKQVKLAKKNIEDK